MLSPKISVLKTEAHSKRGAITKATENALADSHADHSTVQQAVNYSKVIYYIEQHVTPEKCIFLTRLCLETEEFP